MSLAANVQPAAKPTLYRILFAIGLVHLFNDSIQSVITAIYPILKDSMSLSYGQLGWIGFGLSFTASLMQPVVGMYTDARPSPYLLPLGMGSTFIGMLLLGFAPSYPLVLLAVVFVGIGSAVFHPEGSRVSYMAAGSRRGLAQSIFQVGGNAGQALAPILAVFVFYPLGQHGAFLFMIVAAAAIFVQLQIAKWYGEQLRVNPRAKGAARPRTSGTGTKLAVAVTLLVFLVFARSWYHACISNFYLFYLHEHWGLSEQNAQLFIFSFLAAGAAGTFFGGPLADRFGRRNILFLSMLGAAPFALVLPYAPPVIAFVLLLVMGFILLSSFSVAVVYAQELIPGKIGTVSGLITGLAFGLGAIGSVFIGNLIDWTSLPFVMKACSFLPLIGLMTFFLPSDKKLKEWSGE
ncbi:MFS transporter [Paenibacillus aurantius]|uniref:MFS transporter n=1 Tax=Paenibacillus aurantius TaxID=2918900 RepID=A0AA96LIQ2_9BACL|nr:MFS transporter [Paenibacillus aurantius]WNQ12845.1 MFS transporter [Paenibacillus aurantius]